MREATKRSWLCFLAGAVAALVSASLAAEQGRYWRDTQGNVWRNGFGDCVRTHAWTPDGYTPGCDPEPPQTQRSRTQLQSSATHAAQSGGVQLAALEAPAAPAAPQPIALNAVALFDLDSAALRPEAVRAVNQIADQAKGAARIESIVVSGYADSTGPEAYNLRLSERRARAVKEQLAAAGIDAGLIEVAGYGEADPVVSNATSDGRQRNRRVVVEVRAVDAQ